MKIKFFAITLVAAFAAMISACGGGATNTANNTANNANKPANNTNTTTNMNSANNSTNAANNSANNTAATTEKTEGSTVKIEDAGIQMTVPKGFKVEKDGATTIVSTEDEGVAIVFTIPADGDYEKALTNAGTEMDKYIKDVKFEDQGKKDTVDGMDIVSSNGTGKDKDGKEVLFDFTVFNSPKKPVIAITYAEKPSMEKYKSELQSFFKSVKKMS